jgi:molecular chaperone GrpE
MADSNDNDTQQGTAESTGAADAAAHEPRRRWDRKGDRARKPAEGGAEDGAAPFTEAQQAVVEQLIQEKIAAEQAKAEEAQARALRTQADFANYKRRSEQEREGQARFATSVLITELLPILDNFDRALATMPEEVRSLPWTEGLLLVDRQLRATLEKQGLKPIDAVGSRFDPMLHEAIIHEESADHEDDEVIAELQRGYMMHDRVIRPSLVKVAKN